VICPIIGGIPMMLFYTKVKKFGMITVMTIIIGLYLWITGMGYWPFILGIVCGLIADLIAKSGNYSDFKKIALSHGALNVTIFGCFLPLYLNIDAYFATRSSYGTEYVDALKNIFQPWIMPVLFVAAFVCGIIGAILGKALMKKHFEKAGIV
ncbi:MAG: MptD family putative ECF transporter S component, partial [Lachnospiraceae bacterium]|nr:MptD family putative ECF transporter S component [Lachnospiraceae bacterium]